MKWQIFSAILLGTALTATHAAAQTSMLAPKPDAKTEQLLAGARTVALFGELGYVAETGIALNPSAEKAQQSLEKEVRKWGRFTVVENPAKADLVLVLYAGNRAAGGGGVFATAQLVVFPGGPVPKRGDIPFWNEDASGSLLSPAATPKVIAKFRAYLENLDKTISANATSAPLAPATQPAPPVQNSQTTPAQSTQAAAAVTEKKPEESAQPAVASAPHPRPQKFISPFELIGNAKTYTLRGHGAAGEQGTYDKIFGTGKYSDIQSAMADIFQQMNAWGRMQYVTEVPKADLVITVNQWDTRVYSKQFHGIQSSIVVAEGGEAYQREDPPLWTSGAANGTTTELISNLRFEFERSASTQTLEATHDSNKEYNRGCDSLDASEKSKYAEEQKDLLNDAVSELRHALRDNYGYPPAHERLGTALRYLGIYSDAVYEYKLALQLQPTMQEAIRGLAIALARVPDYDEALKAVSEWIRVDPGKAESRRIKGDIYYVGKNYPAAVDAYREALGIDPDQQLTVHMLGRALYRSKHMAEAEKAFRDALKMKPSDQDSIIWLGSTLNEEHQPDEALKVLMTADKKSDKDPTLHYERARALRALKKYDESLKEIETAISLSPTSITYHTEQAVALAAAGKTDEAHKAFSIVLLNLPETADAHVNLAIALLSVNETDAALKSLTHALELDDINARAYFYLGRAREAKGDKAGAESAYLKARTLDPQNQEYQNPKD